MSREGTSEQENLIGVGAGGLLVSENAADSPARNEELEILLAETSFSDKLKDEVRNIVSGENKILTVRSELLGEKESEVISYLLRNDLLVELSLERNSITAKEIISKIKAVQTSFVTLNQLYLADLEKYNHNLDLSEISEYELPILKRQKQYPVNIYEEAESSSNEALRNAYHEYSTHCRELSDKIYKNKLNIMSNLCNGLRATTSLKKLHIIDNNEPISLFNENAPDDEHLSLDVFLAGIINNSIIKKLEEALKDNYYIQECDIDFLDVPENFYRTTYLQKYLYRNQCINDSINTLYKLFVDGTTIDFTDHHLNTHLRHLEIFKAIESDVDISKIIQDENETPDRISEFRSRLDEYHGEMVSLDVFAIIDFFGEEARAVENRNGPELLLPTYLTEVEQDNCQPVPAGPFDTYDIGFVGESVNSNTHL